MAKRMTAAEAGDAAALRVQERLNSCRSKVCRETYGDIELLLGEDGKLIGMRLPIDPKTGRFIRLPETVNIERNKNG